VNVAIVPLQFPHQHLVEAVQETISRRFRVTSPIANVSLSLEAGRDVYRNQVNSTWVLSQLRKINLSGVDKILGITEYDLFLPVLTYVFGEAELGGKVAVVSSHRLHNERYGLPRSDKLLRSRLVCESVHEMGHTFGLTHCTALKCVMRANMLIDQVDLKPDTFCIHCATKLKAGHSSI
jgi:archaemetzincin